MSNQSTKPKSRIVRNLLGLAAIGVVAAVIAARNGDGADTVRAYQIQKCMGIVPEGMSSIAFASYLVDQEARTGVPINEIEALAVMLAEQRNPGVGARCAERFQ